MRKKASEKDSLSDEISIVHSNKMKNKIIIIFISSIFQVFNVDPCLWKQTHVLSSPFSLTAQFYLSSIFDIKSSSVPNAWLGDIKIDPKLSICFAFHKEGFDANRNRFIRSIDDDWIAAQITSKASLAKKTFHWFVGGENILWRWRWSTISISIKVTSSVKPQCGVARRRNSLWNSRSSSSCCSLIIASLNETCGKFEVCFC